ncbi:gallidermin family lantibiotic [Brevibacillus laterosporus]|nr:gallidermin family lantibiotic [Brevibacillus laterosporus]
MKKEDLFDLDVQVKEASQAQGDSVVSDLICTTFCSATFCQSNCC